jgi:tetratricopeptide (TPR) repeat protein
MSKRRKESSPPAPARPPIVLPALALFALTLLAYSPAIPGQYIWDDDDYVHANPNLRHDAGLADIWLHPTHNPQYYPLVFTTFWLEWRIWGDHPAGYRIVNILLHAGSAVLLWRLLRKLEVPGAYLAAAIFAVHPVMVESVAWITERKNVLSLFFYLAAMHAYLRFADGLQWHIAAVERAQPDNRKSQIFLYALSILCFIAALFSKTVTATLPAAILLVLWWKRGRIDWHHAALLSPFITLGFFAGVGTGYLERYHVGAQGPEWSWSLIDRILIASRAVWFYAVKLLAPMNQSFIYPKWTINPHQWWQWLFPLALLITLGLLFALRHRIGKGALVAVLFFIGTLFPALGFFNVFPMRYSFVADHFQYHASIALIALFAAASTFFITRYARWLASSRNQQLTGAALVIVLATLTFLRARTFGSPERLWTDTLAKNPNSWMAWTNIAHLAASRNDHNTAAEAYRKAHALAPHIVDTRYNLALLQASEGDTAKAIAQLEQIVNEEPRHANARQQLARLLRTQGNPAAAIPHLESALRLQPTNDEFRRDLANTCRDLANQQIQQRNYTAAEISLRRILDLRPNDADTFFDLATVFALTNRKSEAAELYARAIQLKPELRNRLPR